MLRRAFPGFNYARIANAGVMAELAAFSALVQ
jgi:hypothetical protein